MAAKKTEKDLKKTVKKLRSQLDRADAKADKWKAKAGQLEKSATKSDARVKKLSKRLDKASGTAEPSSTDDASPTVAPIPAVAAEPEESTEVFDTDITAASEVADSTPDAGWTVVQLRAEARSRGLTGLSGKSKAQLLEALT